MKWFPAERYYLYPAGAAKGSQKLLHVHFDTGVGTSQVSGVDRDSQGPSRPASYGGGHESDGAGLSEPE